MNINQLLIDSIEKLKEKKIITPQLDAELLLGFILKKPREYILIHPEYKLTKLQETRYKKILQRRLGHEPIAYILGQKEFYGLNFKVNKHTLIPRPETELLVENVLKLNPQNKTIIDIGTGSGNIIVSLVKNLRHRNNYFGIDLSQESLSIAKKNAKENKVAEKIKFIKGNLLEPLFGNWKLEIGNSKMIILANLPYLSKKIYSEAMPDVKNFEPRSALLSGINGLDHYEKLFQQLAKIQNTRYKIQTILEISPEQKQSITKLIRKYFPNVHIEFQKDLAKKWRVAIFEI